MPPPSIACFTAPTLILDGEVYLIVIGAHISAPTAASGHVNPDPVRSRKLAPNCMIGQTDDGGLADAGSIPAASTNTPTPTVLGWGFFLSEGS